MNRRTTFLRTAAVVGLFTLGSCTPTDTAPELVVTAEPQASPTPPSTPESNLAALEKVTGLRGMLVDDVVDIHAILLAQDFEAKNDLPAATKAWAEALEIADGAFGKRALDGWIKAYVKALGRKSDKYILARLLLAETKNGLSSPYMRSKQLTSEGALAPLLPALVGDYLVQDPTEPLQAIEAPVAGGGTDDPLLTKAAAKNCGAKQLDVESWQRFQAALNEPIRRYWTALIAQCSGRAREALPAFHELAPVLGRTKATQAMAVEALGRATAIERSLSEKKEAADTFRDLVDAWEKPGVTPEAMGLEHAAFALRHIDETLWASRYRALLGDYETAKILAQKAVDLIANAYSAKGGVAVATRDQLVAFRAEAYHVLAYRIAVEKREFDSALSLDLQALDSPHLTTEWRDRLSWFAGLYEYLGGNFESAKKKWETMLVLTKDDAMRATLYFWLAKVYERLDRHDESRFYLNALVDDYPLSYYTTVATRAAGFTGSKNWHSVFGDAAALKKKLATADFSGLKQRRIPPYRRLLSRCEILAGAGLKDWMKLAVDDLETAWSHDLLTESNLDAFVYLSRLHFAAGSYAKAIALTTKLAKATPGFWQRWPEQLGIYFPMPYGEAYDRASAETGVDKEIMLAVSRQESSFIADIRSPANAVGVMQLIPPTGERWAKELGLTTGPIEEFLKNPEGNIRLGTHYLKFLGLHFKNFPPAVYGSYNAGEYAMETWLERRNHTDPLMFVELLPFGETKDYVRNVWRNVMIYRYLDGHESTSTTDLGGIGALPRRVSVDDRVHTHNE